MALGRDIQLHPEPKSKKLDGCDSDIILSESEESACAEDINMIYCQIWERISITTKHSSDIIWIRVGTIEI